MNNRIKLKYPAVRTRTEMETLVREIASLKLNEKTLIAGMDAELNAVRDNYEQRLGAIAQLLAEKTAAARTWAEASPVEFAGRKSIEFVHGAVGFRTGMPKLKARVKLDAVLDALRSLRWGAKYIRVKEEVNKEQMIADFGARILGESDLLKAGAEVVREETFYVEPKLTPVESREVAEAA